MTTQSNVCVCETCVGTQCTCGCQHPARVPTASCQCGEACNCGEGRSDGAQCHGRHSRIRGRRVVRGARHHSHRSLVV